MEETILVDEQKINLMIEGQKISLFVKRSEEKTFRRAAMYLNERIQWYRVKYPNEKMLPNNAYLMMTAVESGYGYMNALENNDMKPLNDKVSELNQQLEDFLYPYSNEV